MLHSNKKGLAKRISSFKYAFKGMYELVLSEPNAQIHFVAAIVAVTCGFFFGLTATEWSLVVFAIAIVFAAEAFNTVIEKLVDHFFPEYHETARIAKDISAGAVLFCAIGALIVGLIIFIPKILNRI